MHAREAYTQILFRARLGTAFADPLEHQMIRRLVGHREHLWHRDGVRGPQPRETPRLRREEPGRRRRMRLRERASTIFELDGVRERNVAAMCAHRGRDARPEV